MYRVAGQASGSKVKKTNYLQHRPDFAFFPLCLAVKEKKITAKNAKNAKHLGGERKNRKWPFGKNGFVKREIEPILPFFTAYGMTVFLHQEKRRNRKLAAISILPNAKFAFPYLAIQVIHRVFALIATDYLSHFDF